MGQEAAQGFVHLRVRSAYSLLEGAIKADAIGTLAAGALMPAAGLCDRANLFGAPIALTGVRCKHLVARLALLQSARLSYVPYDARTRPLRHCG